MHPTRTPAAPTAATVCTPPTCTGSAASLAVPASSGAGECSPLHRDCMGREIRIGDKVAYYLGSRSVVVLDLLPLGRFAYRHRTGLVTYPCSSVVRVEA